MSKHGLSQASDREIWEYARIHGFTLCSKDSDFRQFSFFYGFPPKTIWLSVGNMNTHEIAKVLGTHYDEIAEFEDSEEALLIIDTTPYIA